MRRYTEDENAEFVAAYRKGGLDAACAIRPHLERLSNEHRLARMGVLDTREYRPWTLDEIRQLKAMRADGQTHDRIAHAIGRSLSAVETMAYRLGITQRATAAQ